jgi:hypothetical protein
VSNSPPGGIELLKKLVEDKPKRQFRGAEMKKAPVWFRLVLLFVTLAGGLALYSVYVARPPGPPSRKPIHEINFKVSEVAERQAEFKPAPNVYV